MQRWKMNLFDSTIFMKYLFSSLYCFQLCGCQGVKYEHAFQKDLWSSGPCVDLDNYPVSSDTVFVLRPAEQDAGHSASGR